jgi:hypothetical protein
MRDPFARRLAAWALGCALLALALAGWALVRAEVELARLRRGIERALVLQRETFGAGPPATLDEDELDEGELDGRRPDRTFRPTR